MNKLNHKLRILVIVSFTLGYLAVGFFPYHWALPWVKFNNQLTYTSDGEMHFNGPGIAFTKHLPSWLADPRSLSSLQISLTVLPFRTLQAGPARIFTISKNPYYSNFIIGQKNSDLVIRIKGSRTSDMLVYKLGKVFSTATWHDIDLRLSADMVRLWVDGVEKIAEPLSADPFSYWSRGYKLALGNELTGDRPWLGAIRRAQVSTQGLSTDYAMPGALYTPGHFFINHARIVSVPFISHPVTVSRVSDWLVNFFGFIPFGFLILFVGYCRSSILIATLWCAALSAGIEIGQLFLVARITSTEDLILNMAGGTVGAYLGMLYRSATTDHTTR